MLSRTLITHGLAGVALLVGSGCVPQAAVKSSTRYAELLSACKDKDGWRDPAPPARIQDSVFYVGTCGISVLLVTSSQGHVLIDTAEEEMGPQILANIRRLGFEPRDIRWLLASHVHYDHTGGHAAMQAATGARIAALADQSRELQQGTPLSDDPQHGVIKGIQPVRVDQVLQDGVPFTVGANQLIPFSTPGHTRGSTSWVIRGCAQATCAPVVYADSASGSPCFARGWRASARCHARSW
jgi:metallo-beta-lactamase class B